jgi:peptidoglycan hydrolase-like protein with peptidoglycan-binding domain
LGAGSGAALGTGNSSNDQLGIQAQYDNAFSQCMYAKGEQVPGFTPVPMAPTTSSSDAPAPSPLIRSTQRELIRLGYLNDVADGYTGPKTRSAIANYQQSIGMSPDGEASSRLLAKLQATPSGGATATASAPSSHVSDWVAPASTAASPSSGWVTPAGGGSAAPASGASAWVAPKAQ